MWDLQDFIVQIQKRYNTFFQFADRGRSTTTLKHLERWP